MSNTALLAALLTVEALGTVTFLVIYLWRSDWTRSSVGRHLALYGVTLFGVYAVTLVRVLHRTPWTFWLMIAGHAAFALAVWQRVGLVIREQQRRNGTGPED
jgi:hypothetical protein